MSSNFEFNSVSDKRKSQRHEAHCEKESDRCCSVQSCVKISWYGSRSGFIYNWLLHYWFLYNRCIYWLFHRWYSFSWRWFFDFRFFLVIHYIFIVRLILLVGLFIVRLVLLINWLFFLVNRFFFDWHEASNQYSSKKEQ